MNTNRLTPAQTFNREVRAFGRETKLDTVARSIEIILWVEAGMPDDEREEAILAIRGRQEARRILDT